MRLPSLAAVVVALFAVLALPAASSAALVDDSWFVDGPDNDGVDDYFNAFHTAFPDAGEINNWTSNGNQFLRITINATHNGDDSMASPWFTTARDRIYTMKASVKTIDFKTPFRARLTVHWKDVNGNYISAGECNQSNTWYDNTFHTLIDTYCRAPAGATSMNIAIRANNGGCDACPPGDGYGTVVVSHLFLERTS